MVAFFALLGIANTQGSVQPGLTYLSRSSIRVDSALSPAPLRASARDQADFEQILREQARRSPSECRRAAVEVNVKLETFFGPAYGPLSREDERRLEPLFESVRADTDYFVQEAKKRWARPRPYHADPRVTPCVPLETTAAYPSGHAAISRVFAKVLARIHPAQAGTYLQRADQIAADRILAGVHHPSDIEAGKKLGDAVFEAMLAKPAFVHELKRLSAE